MLPTMGLAGWCLARTKDSAPGPIFCGRGSGLPAVASSLVGEESGLQLAQAVAG